MKVENVYRAMLGLGPFSVDNKGKIHVSVNSETDEFTVNGKKVYLPTRKVLSSKKVKKVEIFHPLKENVLQGPPRVLVAFKNVLEVAYSNLYLPTLILAICENYHDMQEDESSVTKPQRVYLSNFPEVKGKDLVNISKMMDEMDLLKLELTVKKGNPSDEGNSTITVGSPLLKEINDILSEKGNKAEINGVKLSMKSVKAMQGILRALFGINQGEYGYDYSNHRVMSGNSEAILLGMEQLIGNVSKGLEVLTGESPIDTNFYELDIFANKSTLSKLVKTVSHKSSPAKPKHKRRKKVIRGLSNTGSHKRKKSKKKHKKKRKHWNEQGSPSPYAFEAPMEMPDDIEGLSEEEQLHRMRMTSGTGFQQQPQGVYNYNQVQNNGYPPQQYNGYPQQQNNGYNPDPYSTGYDNGNAYYNQGNMPNNMSMGKYGWRR